MCIKASLISNEDIGYPMNAEHQMSTILNVNWMVTWISVWENKNKKEAKIDP